jgi:uncharacterized protein YndB with AHSA1/START domain
MSDAASVGSYGVLTEPTTLKIQRVLPGPVERVWAYLTDGELRRRWLAAGDMTLQVGAPFEFVWRNDELGDSPTHRPAGFDEEERMASRITEVDPPHRLSFTWEGSGDVTVQLEPQGGEVLLTIVHRRLPDRRTLVMTAAGWHRHLDIWSARADGTPAPPFWEGWSRLRDDYDRQLPH